MKVWFNLRAGDRRNKFDQGIEEARKAASAQGSEFVLPILDAGNAGDLFYAVMTYFPGGTLRDWLRNYSPSLGCRRQIAFNLSTEVARLSSLGLHHGDLHAKNGFPAESVGELTAQQGREVILAWDRVRCGFRRLQAGDRGLIAAPGPR